MYASFIVGRLNDFNTIMKYLYISNRSNIEIVLENFIKFYIPLQYADSNK